MQKTGAVLVAAGMSSRMKDFKPMLPFGDSTIANHIVMKLKDLCIEPIVMVTGYRAEQLEKHLSHASVRFVRNERYEDTEMFDSVRIGLEEIKNDCDRVLLQPIDIPAIKTETIRKVMMADAGIIRPMCNGKPGHPIMIRADMIPGICAYSGNGGLRGAIEHSGVPVISLEVEDEGIYRDVDTLVEYKTLIQWDHNRRGSC